MVEHKQVCSECGGKHHAKGLCQKHYFQRPEAKAYKKAYRQRPEVKAHRKAYYGGVGVHGEQKAARLEKAALDKGFTPESAKAFAVDGLVLEKRLTELMKSG